MNRFVPFIEADVDGNPVSSVFYSRLVSATITDAGGQDGDTCELKFDDANNDIEIPNKGAKLAVRFGFRDTGSWKMGVFEVEKSIINGGDGGQFVTLSGRSADMRQDIKEPISENFDDATIGSIVSELADRHGFGSRVSDEFASLQIPYVARVNQSASDFLTRLADRYGALFSVKDGKFLFLKRGILSGITIQRNQCESWNFTVEPRPKFGTIEAGWFDRDTGKTRFESHSTGVEGPVKRMRAVFNNADEAKTAAQAEGDRGARATGSGSINLAGMPEIMADTPIICAGFRPEANGLWRAKTVTHTYGETYTTSIELEASEEGKE